MLPFNTTPSLSDSSISESSSFSKNNRLSLNGLFGEVTGIDEQMPSTFAIHPSPPPGSYTFARQPVTSPTKSPSAAMLGAQQSILLSDLADSSANTNFQQTVCSYVSDYDNRRCTNPVIDKGFCRKHVEIHQASISTSAILSRIPSSAVDVCDGSVTRLQSSAILTSLQPSNNTNSSSRKSVVMVDTASPNPASSKKSNPHNKANSVPFAGNQSTPINGEVLRTVVDMLNRNRSGLTTKQQIKLLNSLGVIVATVKNPAELQASGAATVSPQPVHTNHGVDLQSNTQINHHRFGKHSPHGPGYFASGLTKPPTASVAKLKRKTSATDNAVSSKRVKKSNAEEKTSLHHLTAVELDERVSEALASVGGLSSVHKNQTPAAKPGKSKKKPAPEKRPKKLPTISSLSLPIYQNPNFLRGISPYETKSPTLNSYISMMKERSIDECDMFSLGPFCDDRSLGICTCTQNQYKMQTPKTKRKSHAKVLPKPKQCLHCQNLPGSTDVKLLNDQYHLKMSLVHMSEAQKLKSGDSFESHGCNSIHSEPKTASLTPGNEAVSNLENSVAGNVASVAPDDLNTVLGAKSDDAGACLKQLKKSRKAMKKQLAGDKRALQLLCAAAKEDYKATAKALRHLGADVIACKRNPKPKFASKCMLGGGQCNKSTLPFTCYCSEHIWHCQEQQLFKLGADMKVMADIFPEPVLFKPRKRAKLPVLGKRKKRKIRKSAAASRSHSRNEAISESAGDNLTNMQAASENDGLLGMLVNVDDCDEDKLENEDKLCDVSAVSVDEAVLDAFNIGDTNFMDDIMPDLLQDFGLFTGKIGDVLDNALLLDGSVDYPEQLTLSEPNDPNMLLSQTNVVKTTSPLKFDTMASSSTSSSLNPGNSGDTTNLAHLPNSSEAQSGSSGFGSGESMSTQDEFLSSQTTTWSQSISSLAYESSYSQSVEDSGNVSSSTDPFSEDLREIEGVLQSLREEVTGDKCASSPICPKDMDADEYTSILAKEISQYAENQVTSKSALLKSPTNINATKPNNPAQAHSCNLLNKCDTGAQTSYDGPQLDTFAEPANQFIELSTTKKTRKSPSKKSKDSSNPTSRSQTPGSTTEHVLQNHDENVLKNHKMVQQAAVPGVKAPNSSATSVMQAVQNTAENSKVKTGRKAKSSCTVPSYITPGMSPVIAQPCRMQPNILAGNVICSPGVVTTTPPSPSMFLIPVNAIVQSGSSGTVAGAPNHVGLAFAVPPGQACIPANFGAVIPVRGSAVMQGAPLAQQFIIVNGNQLSHPVTIRANKRQKATTKKQNNPPATLTASTTKNNAPVHSDPVSCDRPALAATTASQSNSRPAVGILPNPVESPPKWKAKRTSPLVIPPAITAATSNKAVEAKPAASVAQKIAGEKKSGKCGTVHWNQSTVTSDAAPPLPQATRPYGDAGGQTSNMLYCRRISPSLNSSHQVTVGRLGSLGHAAGVSRLAVNERLSQYQKQHNKFKAKPPVDTVKVSDDVKAKTSVGFINIAESCKPPDDVTSAQPAVKRSGRKSEHRQTLRDPDLCENLAETSTTSAAFQKSVPD